MHKQYLDLGGLGFITEKMKQILDGDINKDIKKYETKLNCPNCSAPITSDKCEYCGTVFRTTC